MERIDLALRMTLSGIIGWLIWVLILLIFLASCAAVDLPQANPCAKVTVILEGFSSGVTTEVVGQ